MKTHARNMIKKYILLLLFSAMHDSEKYISTHKSRTIRT